MSKLTARLARRRTPEFAFVRDVMRLLKLVVSDDPAALDAYPEGELADVLRAALDATSVEAFEGRLEMLYDELRAAREGDEMTEVFELSLDEATTYLEQGPDETILVGLPVLVSSQRAGWSYVLSAQDRERLAEQLRATQAVADDARVCVVPRLIGVEAAAHFRSGARFHILRALSEGRAGDAAALVEAEMEDIGADPVDEPRMFETEVTSFALVLASVTSQDAVVLPMSEHFVDLLDESEFEAEAEVEAEAGAGTEALLTEREELLRPVAAVLERAMPGAAVSLHEAPEEWPIVVRKGLRFLRSASSLSRLRALAEQVAGPDAKPHEVLCAAPELGPAPEPDFGFRVEMTTVDGVPVGHFDWLAHPDEGVEDCADALVGFLSAHKFKGAPGSPSVEPARGAARSRPTTLH